MTRHPTPWTLAASLGAVCTGLLAAWPNPAVALPPADDQQIVAEGNAAFALDLYARLRTGEGNLFVSPYSASTALVMTYAGARGETARQMADVLHLTLEPQHLHPAWAALQRSLSSVGDSPECSLHIANALWGQRGEDFLAEFLALTKECYGGGFQQVDFVGATELARQTINAWVAEQTRQKIKELLQSGDLDASTVLVLSNAISFKGNWASRFDPRHTQEGPFHVRPGEDVTVKMMAQTAKFASATTDVCDLLELPYAGERLSMVILLPKQLGKLAALEASLNRENLDKWLTLLEHKPLRVTLPRFTLNRRFDLARTLAAMGMPDAFDRRADFSGMNGRGGLWISKVIHQARVEVSEEGTEAAAATAVVMKRGTPPPAFTVDHPFLFLIRDRQTDSILFLGRVTNPKE